MHRQIAGKLTGRVTKWIVLAAWIVIFVVAGVLRRQAHRRPEQRGVVLAARAAPSRPRCSRSSPATVDPNDIPTLVVYHRDGGLTEADFAAMDEQAAEIAKIDGVTDEGVLLPQRRPGSRTSRVQLVSEDGEVAYLYFTFNFGQNGWNDIPTAADDIRDIAEIDGVDVYVAGFGGQAADSAEAFEGIDTNPASSPPSSS